MKLDALISQLETVRVRVENGEFEEFDEGYIEKVILQLLIEYIGNPKIEEAINEIPF